eukprot:6202244-Pleurochrysis_carterae.AAC.4
MTFAVSRRGAAHAAAVRQPPFGAPNKLLRASSPACRTGGSCDGHSWAVSAVPLPKLALCEPSGSCSHGCCLCCACASSIDSSLPGGGSRSGLRCAAGG